MTGEERIEELIKKGWKVVKDENTWCPYVEFEKEVPCRQKPAGSEKPRSVWKFYWRRLDADDTQTGYNLQWWRLGRNKRIKGGKEHEN